MFNKRWLLAEKMEINLRSSKMRQGQTLLHDSEGPRVWNENQ